MNVQCLIGVGLSAHACACVCVPGTEALGSVSPGLGAELRSWWSAAPRSRPGKDISCALGGPGSRLGDARHTKMTQTRTLPLRRCQSDEGDSCVNRKPQTNVRMHQSSRGVREGFPEEGTSWRSWILTDEDFARVEAVGLEAQWGRAERSGAEVPEKTLRGKDTGQQTRQTGTLSLSSELLLTTFLSFGAERLSPSHIKHTLSVYYLFCTMCVSLVRMQALHRQRSLPVVFRTLFPQGLDRCLVQSR